MKLFKKSLFLCSLLFLTVIDTRVSFAMGLAGDAVAATEGVVGDVGEGVGKDATEGLPDGEGLGDDEQVLDEDTQSIDKFVDQASTETPDLGQDGAGLAKTTEQAAKAVQGEVGDIVSANQELSEFTDNASVSDSADDDDAPTDDDSTEGAGNEGGQTTDSERENLNKELKGVVDEDGNPVKDSNDDPIKEETTGAKAKRWAKEFLSAAGHTIKEQLVMLTFMTIPQIIQTEMSADAQKKAALDSAATPLSFGNWVGQVIADCINMDAPEQSLPFYELYPVSDLGSQVDATTAAKFPGMKINYADQVDSSLAQKIFTFGLKKTQENEFGFPRFYVSGSQAANYYKYAPIVVSYPSSYGDYADAMFSSAQFGGLGIDLKHGMVVDATGEMPDSPPQPPLVKMKNHAPMSQGSAVKSVAHWMPSLLNKLKGAALQSTTTTGYVSSVAGGVSVPAHITQLFDCKETDLLKLSNTTDQATGKVAKVKGKIPCMLQASCEAYNTPQTFGVFGSVVPLYGWGSKALSELPVSKANFPHNVPVPVNQSGVVTEDLGNAFAKHQASLAKKSKSTATENQVVDYASTNENFSVQGCWVYLCAGTPFAKAMQQGSTDASVTGPYVDYVIFLDEDGNQVPMYGLTDSTVWSEWKQIGLNPKAKYMASLISTDMPEFEIQNTVVAYDANGQAAGIPNLQTTVSNVVNGSRNTGPGLTAFPELKAQFDAHKQALLSKYYYGPFKFGNSKLSADTKYNVSNSQGQTVLHVYTGRNCYGSTGSNAVQDVLIAESTSGNPTALPSDSVGKFISLVTDIVYTVDKKTGALVANTQAAFKSAPGRWNGKTFIKDSSKDKEVQWLPYLEQAFAKNSEYAFDKTSYNNLLSYVEQQRDTWLSSELASGVSYNGMTFELAPEINLTDAERNNCFIYEVSPSPSGALVDKDWFVAIDFKQPSLSHLSQTDFINMAANADKALSLVSLVTGNIYNMKGQQVVNKESGERHPAMIALSATTSASAATGQQLQEQTAGEQLLDFMKSTYGDNKGLTVAFEQEYEDAIEKYKKIANRIIMVGDFGGISLGIYAGDLSMGNYVYFNTAGMGNPEHFEPKELFITVDPQDKTNMFGKPLSKNTPMILSLKSGQTFSSQGPGQVVRQLKVEKFVQANKVYWRPWLQALVANMQMAYYAEQAANKQELVALEKAKQTGNQNLIWTPEIVKQRIERLQAVPFLPAPYATLKQDPMNQYFVRLAPASLTNDNEFTYTFFNVPNTYKDADGKPVKVGAIYSPEGELITTLQGSGREAMMHQYGLYGDATGTIAAPMLQPSLLLTDADKNLKAGKSTDTMIVSTSDNFPGNKVAMPSGYYLYFSLIMNNYYLLDTKKNQWVSVDGGHVYNLEGQPIPLVQDVAVGSKSSSGDMLLLQKNKSGKIQGIMKNPVHDNMYESWRNYGTGEWTCTKGKAVVKALAKGTKTEEYKVEFENNSGTRRERKTYIANGSHAWQGLVFLPITKDRKVLTKLPTDPSVKSAQIITSKGQLTNLIFKNQMYRISTSRGQNVFEMVAVDDQAAEPIEVQLLVDPNTNVPYIKVIDGLNQGAVEYRYGYIYQTADSDEIVALRTEVIKGAVTACPISEEVGPMVKHTQGDVTVERPTSRTRTLFVADIADVDSMPQVQPAEVQNLPSQDTSEYQVVVGTITSRVFKSKDGRYFATTDQGYVDLQNASLLSNNGNAGNGNSLSLKDWMNLLNTVRVTVKRTAKGELALVYRNASAIKAQESQDTIKAISAKQASVKLTSRTNEQNLQALPERRRQMLGTTTSSLPPVRYRNEGVRQASRKTTSHMAEKKEPMLGRTTASLPPAKYREEGIRQAERRRARQAAKNNQIVGTTSASWAPRASGRLAT